MNSVYNIFHPPIQQHPSANMLNQLQQFANGLSGNPEQMVRSLLKSGKMSQEQFNNLSKQATQIQNLMMGRFNF